MNDFPIADCSAEAVEAADRRFAESLRPEDNPSTGGVKFDNGKTAYELIPVEGPEAVAKVLAYGAKKYAPRNWEQGMAWSRPYAAVHRHLAAWWSGETYDPDTGYSHLWHVATNVFFLIAYEARGKGQDDRPTKAAAAKP